ncbi:beta-ketoacyl synthase chain length factor [Oligoflexus tunisiensis]|uniref:beta-ketoacyl synthase chain length factor n=1 Tax=Oligoflexus tunisiensis TaxID=708132 RepID=UPI00114D2C88|nr:beta-ketoacyl synthase chain length factor [Oligoflexus tunisiensis]
MNKVHLLVAHSESWTPESQLRLASPFFRRMTALQKAVVQAFAALEAQAPDGMIKARECKAPIFYSSGFGELGAMLQVTRAIADADLPVSPKEFQHSVQNAALAYLSMTHGIRHPCYALSGGFLSADNCLQLAQLRMTHGLDALSFVIHAHEYLDQTGAHRAQAEILLLSCDPDHALRVLDFCRDGSLEDFSSASPEIYTEDESRIPPWLLNQGLPAAARLVRSLSGESLVTQWLPIP